MQLDTSSEKDLFSVTHLENWLGLRSLMKCQNFDTENSPFVCCSFLARGMFAPSGMASVLAVS